MAARVRSAVPDDAPAMAAILNALIEAGGTTAHRAPFGPEQIVAQFLASQFAICCHCAWLDGAIVGFQALEWSDPDWPGPDPLPADWAIIATYVAAGHQRRRIGGALFAATRAVAQAAGVRQIDATILRENAGGLAYYGGLGFVDYGMRSGAVAKVYRIGGHAG